MPGYRIVCDAGQTTGTFSVCNDVQCADCPMNSRFRTDQCLANPREFGAQSVTFRCPGSGPFQGMLGGGMPMPVGSNAPVPVRSSMPMPSVMRGGRNDTMPGETRVGNPRPSTNATVTATRAPLLNRTLESGTGPRGSVSMAAVFSLSVAMLMTYVIME